MRPLLPPILTAALVAAPSSAIAAGGTSSANEPRTISVEASASVTQANDRARFAVAVVARRPTAAGALSASSSRARAVLRALTASGVAAKDVQTGRLSVTRVGHRRRGTRARVIRYVGRQTLRVTVRRLDRAGAVIDAAVRAGASEVDGPTFAVGDPDDAYARALVAALAKARAKAERMAAATGMTLGSPRSITESGAEVYNEADFERSASPKAAPRPPVRPGESRVEASVRVVYEMTAPGE